MSNKLLNKVAIVTGGTSGMGKATSKLFASEGAKVVIAGIVPADGAEVVADIKANGGEALYVDADVTKPEDLDNLVECAVEAYGGIDILINNAGYLSSSTMLDISLDEWNYTWAVNVTGPFYLSKIVIPIMQERGAGSIVNIASIAALESKFGEVAYTTTKSASLGLTRSIAREFGPTIRANCIMPGIVMTPMFESEAESPGGMEFANAVLETCSLKRFGQPEDIANVCLFFASDQSSYMTGQCVRVDGGIDL